MLDQALALPPIATRNSQRSNNAEAPAVDGELRVELNEDEEDLDSGEDDGSEEGSDEDDYYDEEIDDDDEEEDQEEMEIFVGRNPDIDRLSNMDVRGILAGAVGAGGRLGNFRRDDLISMNNMSVDMVNMGQRGV